LRSSERMSNDYLVKLLLILHIMQLALVVRLGSMHLTWKISIMKAFIISSILHYHLHFTSVWQQEAGQKYVNWMLIDWARYVGRKQHSLYMNEYRQFFGGYAKIRWWLWSSCDLQNNRSIGRGFVKRIDINFSNQKDKFEWSKKGNLWGLHANLHGVWWRNMGSIRWK
jgi:hypothetical protein